MLVECNIFGKHLSNFREGETMIIVIDKETKEIKNNMGTNSLFPTGGVPNLKPKENEMFIKIHDDSVFAELIMSAYDYELILDENNDVTNVIVHKTLEQYRAEQPIPTPQPSELDLLKEDVNATAEMTAEAIESVEIVAGDVAVVMTDTIDVAETLALAIVEIENLKAEISALKGE